MAPRKYNASMFPRDDQEERLQLMEWRIRNGLNPSDGQPMPEDIRKELVEWVETNDDSRYRRRRRG